jgi:hypothetical protein
LENGTRDSGGTNRGAPIALFGYSFIEGYGLDDKETIPWKLQEQLPLYDVRNYGVSGYSTYSVLLVMQQVGRQLQESGGAVVIYGFADFHAPRNVKTPCIQKRFGDTEDADKITEVYPICDDYGCTVWRGASMEEWWRRSRFLSLVGNAWDAVFAITQPGLAERVTDRILVQMKDEAASRATRLIIAPVTVLSARWRDFFARNGFEVVECVSSEMSNPEHLQADSHPNERWATKYAGCLAHHLAAAETKAVSHDTRAK